MSSCSSLFWGRWLWLAGRRPHGGLSAPGRLRSSVSGVGRVEPGGGLGGGPGGACERRGLLRLMAYSAASLEVDVKLSSMQGATTQWARGTCYKYS
jgi:hypothetical protein